VTERSKSEKKRGLHKVADQLDVLLQFSEDKIRTLPLDPDLIELIVETKSMRTFGAIRRQKRYLTRRLSDVDLQPTLRLVQQWQGSHLQSVKTFHLAEHWRHTLLETNGDIDEFISQYPAANKDILRLLIHTAKQAPANDKRHYRALFRHINDIIQASHGV